MRTVILVFSLMGPFLAAVLPAQGRVAGTVFLRLANGETIRGSGLGVKILAMTVKGRERVRLWCKAHEGEDRPQLTADSLLSARSTTVEDSKAALDLLLQHIHAYAALRLDATTDLLTVARLTTNVDGHFASPVVPAGNYFIFATWARGDERTNWLVPVRVANGVSTLDLSNSNDEPDFPSWMICDGQT